MGDKFKGHDRYIYVNTGTVDTPVWTVLDASKDLNRGLTKDKIDDTTRGIAQGGYKSSTDGLKDVDITFDMLEPKAGEDADAGYAALLAGYDDNAEVEVLVADNAITGDDIPCQKYTVMVYDASEADPINDNAATSFGLSISGADSVVEGTCTDSEFSAEGS